MRNRWLSLLCSLLLAAATPVAAFAEEAGAGALKAAFIFNFALYAEWPQAPPETVVLCVAGKDDVGEPLDALTARQLKGRPLAVRRLNDKFDFDGCHILYVAAAAESRMAQIQRELRGRPVLTISQTQKPDAVMIRLAPSGDRLVFDIDNSLAQSAGLVLGSKLLRLARNVK